jgi:hypothetical protein
MEKRQMNIHLICVTKYSQLARLIPIFILVLLITGCGNKTLPTPISQEAPPQIRDLQAKVNSKGVELSWSLSDLPAPADSREAAIHLSIQKSELSWENRSCLDCPATNQQELVNIDPFHPQPAAVVNEKLTWVDPAVSPRHAYRYLFTLLDKKGRQLAVSTVIAKVLPPPGQPRDLQAATEPQGIILRWKPPTTAKYQQGQGFQGDLQFLVERHAPGGAWEKASAVPVKSTTFMDPAVASTHSYDYRVVPILMFEGTSIVGESAVVQQVKAPDALPPPPPKTVWVVPAKGVLDVQWTESEGKVRGYHVYRREGKEITRLTSTAIPHPPYVDRSVRKNVIYYYAVSAVSSLDDQREGLLSKWVEIRSLSFE